MPKGKRGLRTDPAQALPEPLRIAVDKALAPYGPRPVRSHALPILQSVQGAAGWLSPETLAYVSHATRLPLAELTGLATFYELLSTEPQGRVTVRVCDDILCDRRGQAAAMVAALGQTLGIRPGETTADGRFTLHTTNCLGACDRAPCALVETRTVGPLSADAAGPFVANAAAVGGTAAPEPPIRHGWLPGYRPVLLARCGQEAPAAAGATDAGDWQGLRRALAMAPDAVIADVMASGLVGRGGAGFPTGVKWQGACQASGTPKYVVLNADESEPGTFTNRKLLTDDPLLVIEGMIIAAYAIGARHGYAYIRGEYETAAARFTAALQAARADGFLGKDVLGSGWAFDIEVRRGAGAYICGEETALFKSIEGWRGEPQMKPPFPTTHGLFGQPTVINNAETLACVPGILGRGPAAFVAETPKLFAVSGDVALPGVYEAPLGTPLRKLIEACCGGFAGQPVGVLMGGAAGNWLQPDELNVALDNISLRTVGASLGSGAIMVFGTGTDLWAVGERLARFFASESCGKCVPCRTGTLRQWETVHQMRQDGFGTEEAERLDDLAAVMTDASICGLGQSASWAIQSLLRKWGPPGSRNSSPPGGEGP